MCTRYTGPERRYFEIVAAAWIAYRVIMVHCCTVVLKCVWFSPACEVAGAIVERDVTKYL
jgi:hypothetical protein